MGNPRIVWNTNVLDFPELPGFWENKPASMRNLVMSDGGIHAGQLKRMFFEGRIVRDKFANDDFEAALWAWFAWAVQGKQYAIARDSAQMYDSTNTVSVGSGATTCTVGSTVGLTIGDWIYIRSQTAPDIHKAKITGLTGTVITFTGYPSKYTFPTVSIVRHADYLPKVVSLDDTFPVTEELTTRTLDHRFREDAA